MTERQMNPAKTLSNSSATSQGEGIPAKLANQHIDADFLRSTFKKSSEKPTRVLPSRGLDSIYSKLVR